MQKTDLLLTIKRIWNSLQNETDNQNGWKLLKLEAFPSGSVFAGRHYPDNTESVVFTFTELETTSFNQLPEGNGFEVRSFTDKNLFSGTGLAINRKPGGNFELFFKMVEDVLGIASTRTENNSHKTVKLILDRIKAWQKFMQFNGNTKLTLEQEIGLWGELEFIQKAISFALSPSSVISAWKGPLDELHDFSFGNQHVEIKTSSSINGFSINIGNLDQLMPQSDNELYLQAFLLKKDSGKTLNEQIDSVKQILIVEPDILTHFQSLLLRSGYSSDDADKYTQTYHVISERMFVVDQYFPCIHRGNVPASVQTARYTLDVNRIDVSSKLLNDFFEGVKNGTE